MRLHLKITRLSLILSLLGTVACASRVQHSEDIQGNYASAGEASPKVKPTTQRAIIKTATQRLEVEQVFIAANQIAEAMVKNGGYVERSEVEGGTSSTIQGKVPSEKLDILLNEIAAFGKEKERSISSRDVTENKIDLEAQIKNLIVFRDRLRALVAQGKELKEIIELEEQLNRIQTELDSLQTRLDKLKAEVAYSSLTIYLRPKQILGPLGYLAYGFYWSVEKLFIIQ